MLAYENCMNCCFCLHPNIYLANRIIALSGLAGKYSAAAAAAYAEKIVGGGGESHDPKNRRRRRRGAAAHITSSS